MIMVEGIDGVGKSTFVGSLSPYGYIKHHFNYDEKNLDLFTKYRNVLLRNERKIALDRSFLSEMVYGPVIRGKSRLSDKEFVELLKLYDSYNFKLFYLYATKECLLKRRKDDLNDYKVLVQYYDDLYTQYNKVISICRNYIETFIFNTEIQSLEEINSEAKKVLKI